MYSTETFWDACCTCSIIVFLNKLIWLSCHQHSHCCCFHSQVEVNGTTVIECTLVQGRVKATHPMQQHPPDASNDGGSNTPGALKRVAAKHTAMRPMRVAATHSGINGQWSSVGATHPATCGWKWQVLTWACTVWCKPQLRWGPTQLATCNAKWKVCTHTG